MDEWKILGVGQNWASPRPLRFDAIVPSS